mgnify:CR=1 FL=1
MRLRAIYLYSLGLRLYDICELLNAHPEQVRIWVHGGRS